MSPACDHTPSPRQVNPQYAIDFNKVAATVETRCKLTGETPAISEIETQLILRSSLLKPASHNRDLKAIRKVISWVVENENWSKAGLCTLCREAKCV